MDTISQLTVWLNDLLPLHKLLADLHRDLQSTGATTVSIKVETGSIDVPTDATADVIARVMHYDAPEQEVSFRAVGAVGGIIKYNSGFITPQYCFAKLFSNEHAQCSSID